MIDEAYKKFCRDWGNMNGGKHDAGNPTGPEIWHHGWRAALHAIANEFDRRAPPGTGFYTPDEPAKVIRAWLRRTPPTKD